MTSPQLSTFSVQRSMLSLAGLKVTSHPGSLRPALERADVIGPLKGRRVGAPRQVQPAAKILDSREVVLAHPAAEPAVEGRQHPRAVPEQHGQGSGRLTTGTLAAGVERTPPPVLGGRV